MLHGSVINDANAHLFTDETTINGEKKSRGLMPRDYGANPFGCYSFAEPFPDSMLIPEDELDDALAAQNAAQASLLHLRESNYDVLKSLDQDGEPLCWAFSATKAIMYVRAIMGLPPLRLSAWWVAGKVKGWRSQGGWGGESLQKIVSEGVPTMDLCPSYRSSYDTAETRANAALHKCTEWWEGSDDPEKAWHQAASAHARGLPTIEDYNFWSHSVCGIVCVSYKGRKKKIDNSWGESAGDKGIYTLEGSKVRINGLWIPRVVKAA